jgi:hypothetical protein
LSDRAGNAIVSDGVWRRSWGRPTAAGRTEREISDVINQEHGFLASARDPGLAIREPFGTAFVAIVALIGVDGTHVAGLT